MEYKIGFVLVFFVMFTEEINSNTRAPPFNLDYAIPNKQLHVLRKKYWFVFLVLRLMLFYNKHNCWNKLAAYRNRVEYFMFYDMVLWNIINLWIISSILSNCQHFAIYSTVDVNCMVYWYISNTISYYTNVHRSTYRNTVNTYSHL